VINGEHKCLQAGQTCQQPADRQYHAYGFHCHRYDPAAGQYRLTGGGANSPPPRPAPQPTKPRPRAQVIDARVTSVADGDTINMRAFGAKRDFYRVRLLGIDTPEPRRPGVAVECGGKRATTSMYQLAFSDVADLDGNRLLDDDGGSQGRRVTLVTDPTQDLFDGYGRLLAYATTRQGVNLGRRQLARGWAAVYVFDRPFARLGAFRAAQRRARSGRRGAWRLCGGNFHRRARSAIAAARRFRGRAIGNSASGPVPKHAFPVGAGYQLRFQGRRRADTPYRLCAWMNGRRRGCARGRTGRRGHADNLASYDIYNPQSTGLLIWRWYVGGRRVARWDVNVTIGD
jgi:micrococcal nuclease